MHDELRSSIKYHLVLLRIGRGQGIQHFYMPITEQDLFGTVRMVRNLGRSGTNGQEFIEVFPDELEASLALKAVAKAKRRRGYRDV